MWKNDDQVLYGGLHHKSDLESVAQDSVLNSTRICSDMEVILSALSRQRTRKTGGGEIRGL